ncbi:hypothetical protein HAX54_044100, partial [Datura stramonium]|nr:hypothetical protein [Datura stramonium]
MRHASKAGTRLGRRRLCPGVIRHVRSTLSMRWGVLSNTGHQQQLGAMRQRLPTPKNGSPTSIRKRNFTSQGAVRDESEIAAMQELLGGFLDLLYLVGLILVEPPPANPRCGRFQSRRDVWGDCRS